MTIDVLSMLQHNQKNTGDPRGIYCEYQESLVDENILAVVEVRNSVLKKYTIVALIFFILSLIITL